MLDRQSAELVGCLEALFQRLLAARPPEGAEVPECSREEFRALITLSARPAAEPGLKMSELAAALGVPLSTATHTVDRLVAKDLVARRRSPQDRRVVEVALSGRGNQMKELFRRERLAMAHSWLEPLSGAERTHFLELMAKIATLAKPARKRTKGPNQ